MHGNRRSPAGPARERAWRRLRRPRRLASGGAAAPAEASAAAAYAPAPNLAASDDREAGLQVRVSVPGVVGALAAGAALLVGMGILAEISRVGLGHGRLGGLVPLVDLDGEANLPALYSGALLAMCAGVAWLVSSWQRQSGRPRVGHLRLLSLLLVAMAVDEIAQVHELVTDPIRDAFGLGGVLHFSWVVVYGVVAAALLVWLLPLVREVPAAVRAAVLWAVALYLTGALGFEMVGGAVVDAGGRLGVLYAGPVIVEESLEFAGVLLLLHALMTVLRDGCGAVHARLSTAA